MGSLTTKELNFLKESINMAKNHANFFCSCAQTSMDADVKALCEGLAEEHKENVQILSKYIFQA